MGNCFKADIIRLHRKPSMIVFMCVQIFLFVALIIVVKMLADSSDGKGLTPDIAGGAGAAGLFIGIPAYLAAIKDDFKSRTMQVAVGFGVPRSQMVICRFLEICMLFVEIFVIQTILGSVLGMAFGYDIGNITEGILEMWIGLIPVISHVAIALLVVYASMNHTLGLVIYIMLELGIINIIFSLTEMIPFLKDSKIDFSQYWVDGAVVKAMTQAPVQEALSLVIIFAVYVAVPVAVAAILFKKKELDA